MSYPGSESASDELRSCDADSGHLRVSLFDEILADFDVQLEDNPPVDRAESNRRRQELIEAHPDFAAALRRYFEDFDGIRCALVDSVGSTAESVWLQASLDPGIRIGLSGEYEILRLIGRGGMAEVYLAKQQALDRFVAIKMVQKCHRDDPIIRERFLREPRLIASLEHPHIVTVFDVREHEGTPYFSMEYCPGGNLKQLIDEKPLASKEVAQYVCQIARAVQFAHERGVLHRDLKPANVLIDRDGQPLVSDFGLATPLTKHGDLTDVGQTPGTLSYMAPEQLDNAHGDVSTRTDVYALGVTMFELLTSSLPFQAHFLPQIHQLILNQQPHFTPEQRREVDADLQTIALKCLEKDPHRRFSTAEELARELERFLHGEPIESRPISSAMRFWRWAARNRVVAALVAALVTVFIVAAVVGTSAYVHFENRRNNDHDVRVRTARSAASRGDWHSALNAFDEAIRDRFPDRLELKVERLRAWFALGQRDRLEREIQDLTARSDLDSHLATVELLYGDYLMSETTGQEKGRTLVRRALAAGTLSDADQEYATALVALSSTESIENCRRALAIDRFHHRAHSGLVMGLFFVGKFDESRRHAEIMQLLFPDDPLPIFVTAWMDLYEDGIVVGTHKLKRLVDTLGKRKTEYLIEFLEFQHNLMQIMESYRDPTGMGLRLGGQLKLMRTVASAKKRIFLGRQLGLGPLGLSIPAFPWAIDSWSVVFEALTVLRSRTADRADVERVVTTLEETAQSHQESTLLFLAAYLRVVILSNDIHEAGNVDQKWTHLLRGAELFNQAVKSPTLLAWIHDNAQVFETLTLLELMDAPGNKRPFKLIERISNNIWDLNSRSKLRHRERKTLATFVAMYMEPPKARWLLEQWQQTSDATDSTLSHCRARLELRDQNYAAAIQAAERALVIDPNDSEMRSIQRDAAVGLKKGLQKLE